jgi:glyoxylase-like metal-dependent hydrolase (beta-lactamase superfamily II)
MRLTFRVLIAFTTPIVVLVAYLASLSLQADLPHREDKVFVGLDIGELWSDRASYVDDWYAVEEIDSQTFIIGEPKSSQYNSSFLLEGEDYALLMDAGSSQRPSGSKSMAEIAGTLTDKPILLIISHMHFDHIGDLSEFNGAILVAQPFIVQRAAESDRTFALDPIWSEVQGLEPSGKIITASSAETAFHGTRDIRVAAFIQPGGILNLGDRPVTVITTVGHTYDSLSVIDHARNYAFSGDFMYQHFGGVVAFLPGAELKVYIESIDAFLSKTGPAYRFFGSHGQQEYDYQWAVGMHTEMAKIRDGLVEPRIAGNFMSPGVPLQLHQKGPLLIYMTPFFDSAFIFSRYFVWMAAMAYALFSIVLFVLLGMLPRKKVPTN